MSVYLFVFVSPYSLDRGEADRRKKKTTRREISLTRDGPKDIVWGNTASPCIQINAHEYSVRSTAGLITIFLPLIQTGRRAICSSCPSQEKKQKQKF